jgi:hypothetical protein
MNDIDNSIKLYLTLCRQKQLNVVHRIVDDLVSNRSIDQIAMNHNLSTNTVNHTNRIYHLVGGDSMKIIANRIDNKYNSVGGKSSLKSFISISAARGVDQAKKTLEEGNKKIIEGDKKLAEINTEAQNTANNLNQLKNTASELGAVLGLNTIGKTISDHLLQTNQTDATTIKKLQDENDELKKQLEECNKKLNSKVT